MRAFLSEIICNFKWIMLLDNLGSDLFQRKSKKRNRLKAPESLHSVPVI